MLAVDEYGRIRRAHRDGMSIREIARQFHHSRYKIREVLRGGGEPPKYVRRETQSFPKLGSVLDHILEILKTDESAPPK
jgi:IS30 family transposase